VAIRCGSARQREDHHEHYERGCLPEIVPLSDFTENTFLSGFYGSCQPGMLEKLGHTAQAGKIYTTQGNAIFLVKDFTSVLTMRREKGGYPCPVARDS
jgi:hypothetical protein